jgi:hypothetical protein
VPCESIDIDSPHDLDPGYLNSRKNKSTVSVGYTGGEHNASIEFPPCTHHFRGRT